MIVNKLIPHHIPSLHGDQSIKCCMFQINATTYNIQVLVPYELSF